MLLSFVLVTLVHKPERAEATAPERAEIVPERSAL
jgi:hypothetical protein